MGGGSNSSPPVDVAPGGGTYPVDQYGNAYNPAWGGGTDYSALGSALGKGVGTASQQLAAGMTDRTIYMSGVPKMAEANIPGGSPQTNLIPQSGGGVDLLAVLQRLLAGMK